MMFSRPLTGQSANVPPHRWLAAQRSRRTEVSLRQNALLSVGLLAAVTRVTPRAVRTGQRALRFDTAACSAGSLLVDTIGRVGGPPRHERRLP